MGTLADRIGTSFDREVVRPRNGGAMFKYKLYLEDGAEVGAAPHTQHIKVGEIIWAAGTRQFRVGDVGPVDEEAPLERTAGRSVRDRPQDDPERFTRQ